MDATRIFSGCVASHTMPAVHRKALFAMAREIFASIACSPRQLQGSARDEGVRDRDSHHRPPKVVDIGNCSGEDVDKFDRFGLRPLPAKTVQAPLIAECLANIECRLEDTRLVNKYQLFILRVTALWHDPARKERRTLHHNGNGTFTVDGRTIDLRDRMVKWRQLID